MYWTEIEGNWQQFKGRARSKWSKLTEEDVDGVRGKRAQLVSKIVQRYGVMDDDAERQIDTWLASVEGPRPEQRASESRPEQSRPNLR
jgi:uncharacterized protein YjbJ (UPF0337 family)